MKSIFIFRRDFRIQDNKAFQECYNKSSTIVPIFIFTPEQIDSKKNKYFSNNSVQFMIEALFNLNSIIEKELGSRLYFFYGKNVDILNKIKEVYDYDAIFYNKDYTPYALKRDKEIQEIGIDNIVGEDYLLHPMDTIMKNSGEAYQIYTPFKMKARSISPDKPFYQEKWDKKKFPLIKNFNLIDKQDILKFYVENKNLLVKAGREEGLKILDTINKFHDYDETRNELDISSTLLSAYIKFGCLSIREVYWKIADKIGIKSGLIDQLYWRECYYYIAYHHPKILEGHTFNPKFENIKWRNNEKEIKAWLEGKTGFPVVDAGMREIKKTGYMHNRARLITANFLVRILGVDWKIGEMLYAQLLTDYDPVVNNGNWQWIASCGIDPKPHSQRVFNPWTQNDKFDKKCEYVKKWLPELKDVPSKDILKWDKCCTKYTQYLCPIVDYKKRRDETIKEYDKSMGKY